ncbi:hypothetical protein E3N88_04562 [Mikania micrantha]|uniref:Retrotransposon gag domain-containing protein n=1 Tax=Mikania micrantha TaxID=192012 RepID=A0A5N6PUT7_9ASTR|nr:hypothetical protein E3N88_04562 [Mikania micrantha]
MCYDENQPLRGARFRGLTQQLNVNPVNPKPEQVNQPKCSFKHFNSCNPPKYNGSDGATRLLQWFEGMESTFLNSDCPAKLKVRYATGALQKRALTWWNNEKRTIGESTADELTWDQLKERMTLEFCPRNEVKKLEFEFWDLKQDSGENLAYNNRFHELSLLCPHMVTPLQRWIEKYIGGLPMVIQDSVLSSNPATVADAIRLASTLTDNHVKDGTLTRKGSKKEKDQSKGPKEAPKEETKAGSSSSSKKNRKRKAGHMNFDVTHATPLQQFGPVNTNAQANKKAYTGPFPMCANWCQRFKSTPLMCKSSLFQGKMELEHVILVGIQTTWPTLALEGSML